MEGGDARRDVVIHPILIEVVHLLLDRPIDTGVARVETDDEATFIVVFLHQGKLLLQIQIGGAAHHRTRLGAGSQCLGYQTAGVENQIRTLQHLSPTDRYQLWITRSGTDNLDMSLASGFPT